MMACPERPKEYQSSQKRTTVRYPDYRMAPEISKAMLTRIDQHLSAVHDWLSPLFQTFNSIQHETFNMVARQDGLGLRLMKSTQYKQWQSEEGKALWCLGSRKLSILRRSLQNMLAVVASKSYSCRVVLLKQHTDSGNADG